MNFTIVIPVMRKPMLGRVLRHYRDLTPDLIGRIVVVDYDDFYSETRRLYEPLAGIPHLRIGVKSERYFNKARAINLGVTLSRADYVIVCDADVLIGVETLSSWRHVFHEDKHSRVALSPAWMVETADGSARHGPGIVALKAEQYFTIQGYSSEFVGWGFEDNDFLWRLEAVGVDVIKSGRVHHISHGESERIRNYSPPDGFSTHDPRAERLRMRERNLGHFEARKRDRITTGSLFADLALFGLKNFLPESVNRPPDDRRPEDVFLTRKMPSPCAQAGADARQIVLQRLDSRAAH